MNQKLLTLTLGLIMAGSASAITMKLPTVTLPTAPVTVDPSTTIPSSGSTGSSGGTVTIGGGSGGSNMAPVVKNPNPSNPFIDPTQPPPVATTPDTTPDTTTIVTVAAPTATTSGTCDSGKEGFTKVDQGLLFYCDGANWQVLLLDSTTKTCTSSQLGKYAINGKQLEFCNGTNWLITGSKVVEACSQQLYGKIKFAKGPTSNTKVVQFCDGENWLDTTKKDTTVVVAGSCVKTSEDDPVCGADGVMYKNSSYALCAGAVLDHTPSVLEKKSGICKIQVACTTQVVIWCGSDGNEYYEKGCGALTLPPGVTATKGMCAF